MDRRFFLRAGALAGAAAALPATPSGLDALFRPVRGSGPPADPLLLNSNENPLGIGPLARAATGVSAALLLYPGLLPWRPLPGISVLALAGALLLAAVAFAPRGAAATSPA